MENKIRVDQSHCNYQLSKHLSSLGWNVIFRDPGRVTRGYSGDQEVILGIFERNGWPIPDIAAILDKNLLLIEVDKSIKLNIESLLIYREKIDRILFELSNSGFSCSCVRLGFCKVGAMSRNEIDKLSAVGVDFLADFPSPMLPKIVWASSSKIG